MKSTGKNQKKENLNGSGEQQIFQIIISIKNTKIIFKKLKPTILN